MKMRSSVLGVTLIEMILVAAVASLMIFAGIQYMQYKTQQMRIDKATLQMQQMLNAALSYYTAQGSNGKWPASASSTQTGLDCLRANSAAGTDCTVPYLPANLLTNPWGGTYYAINTASSVAAPLFTVWTSITSTPGTTKGLVEILAGTLPLAYSTDVNGSGGNPPPPPAAGGAACSNTDTTCYVVTMVNIPGQSLNSVISANSDGAVKFAGLYHHGACVPVPACQAGNTPQIFLVPVSVSGVYDADTDPRNLYSINSFTAYAEDPKALPDECSSTATTPVPGTTPCKFPGGPGEQADPADPASAMSNPPLYWRACLQVITDAGQVPKNPSGPNTSQAWGKYVTMMAITRCAVTTGTGEATGSGWHVFSN